MKTRRPSHTISLTIPEISINQILEDVWKKIIALFSLIGSAITDRMASLPKFSFSFSSFNRRRFASFPLKRYIPLTILILIVLGILVLVGRKFLLSNNKSDQRIELKGALATSILNKTIQIPVLDSKGATVTNVAYTIESAELRDEIIVQSRRMVAIQGRLFLILNIKLVNEYNKELEIKAGDYVRLSLNNNEKELLAPDIHNDPVRVQAISTKYTRVGFPIYDKSTNTVLYIGAITGQKEKVPLALTLK